MLRRGNIKPSYILCVDSAFIFIGFFKGRSGSNSYSLEIDRIKREKDSDSEDFVDLHLNSI
ncbi:hypothetical protein L249_7101 [Ophiocordyceps polyrhachis-furcata BCC 54312]|uniref:Uncharacterized protein n=1 Tax=Ophiocordyceps polyrhachis-furcata BCC 54312 TaxID=1330021 RepID=A0A367LKH7_9HYPO|nr:hypothetical protein L249_7101 [Ophiocordyceps polyrhachis-furcata BCC 54312]